MSEFRIRSTGEIKTQGQIRKENPNISLPRIWNQNVYDVLEIDPILESARPEKTRNYSSIIKNGVVQDSNGNWIWNWEEVDMFSEYVDGDGVTHTKTEQEQQYQQTIDDQSAEIVRNTRNRYLSETDWYITKSIETSSEISTDILTYRQALRDITSHPNFPNLTAEDWPVKPEM